MPFGELDFDRLSDTFEVNTTNLMDAIQYGFEYQKLLAASDASTSKGMNFSEEDAPVFGFSEEATDAAKKGILAETCNVFMPPGTNAYDSFKYIMYGLAKTQNKESLEQAAIYNQILDSLPEDEPNREDKAMYLFDTAGYRNFDYGTYVMDLTAEANARLRMAYEDITDGKNHDGNWKEVTIGEVLDGLGFDEAQKQEFVKRHDFTSVDETLYASELRRDKLASGLQEDTIQSNAKNHLIGFLQVDANREAKEAADKELSLEEAGTLKTHAEKVSKITEGVNTDNINAWIKEKGQKLSDDLSKVRTASTAQNSRLRLDGKKSLSNVSANAPLKDSLEIHAKETAYVGQIIKGEKTADQVLGELRENVKTAREFIDEVKTELRENPLGVNDQGIEDDNHPYKQFATIFAARILADSERGKKATLGGNISRQELDQVTEKLMNNTDFNEFISKTYLSDDDENLTKLKNAENRLCSSRTHGGFIEDEFKKYLLKKKPGELENSPELARFMPTARERIDELKRQVKKNPEDRQLQAEAAAEIIAIRNACKVERKTGYNLDKQIPPAQKEDERINKETGKMSRDYYLSEILQDDNTRRDLLSANSHGGKMMINARKQYDFVGKTFQDPQVSAALKKNTVGSRMQELHKEAGELVQQLNSKYPKIRLDAQEKSKEILGEYMTMVGEAMKPQGKETDIPWKTAGILAQDTLKNATAGEMMKSPEKASSMMAAIASGDMNVFRTKFKQELDAANAPEQQAPEIVQEKVEEKEQAVDGPALG